MERTVSRRCRILLGSLIVGIGGFVGLLVVQARRGLSARDEPSRIEELVARSFRRLAMPKVVRDVRNPVASSTQVLAAGRLHFADHCSSCHGNDGSGQTEIGRGLYPRAPDMRLPSTQALSDGELFSIIRNGIRLTGMPAWGNATAEDDLSTWKLVRFIRHLPNLSDAELEEMRRLNPRSPAELMREREVEEFLSGKETPTEVRHH